MLLRHSFAYLWAKGLPGLINFAALMIYTRLLSPYDYGRYALTVAYATMAGLIIFQWQRRVVSRWLPTITGSTNNFLGTVLSQFLVLAVSIGLVSVPVLGIVLADSVLLKLAVCGLLLLVANSWLEINLTIASTQLDPSRYGLILGTKTVAALVIGIVLVWAGAGAYGALIGLIAGCLIGVFAFGSRSWRGVRLKWPSAIELREQLSYGLPMAATLALSWIIDGSDRILIGWLINAEAAGQYAAAYDLAQSSLILLLMIVQVPAYSLVLNIYEKKGPEAARDQISQNADLIIGLAIAGAVWLAVMAPKIANLVVGKDFSSNTAILLPLIAIGAALGGIKSFHFDITFHVHKQGSRLVVTSAITALINVMLNIIFIPKFGLIGAAWATILAYAAGLASSIWLGRASVVMPAIWPATVKSICVGGACAAGALILTTIFKSGLFGLFSGMIGGGAAALAMALILDVAKIRTSLSDRLRVRA